jgi:hypothetical protein
MAEIDQSHDGASAGGQGWYRRWRAWAVGALALVAVAGGLAGGLAGTAGTGGTGSQSATGPATSPTAPTSSTTSATTSAVTPTVATVAVALSTASAVEEQAKASYDAVVAQFGDVRPFSAISDAEGQHIVTLSKLAVRYGVSLPSEQYSGETSPATLAEACQMGVRTEQNIVAMYTQLLSEVSSYADLTQAFSNLQSAARDDHLPAFERCA